MGLPSNLFYSTGIPVCILVLKKCKKPDDVLFINASEHFEKDRRQNRLLDEHIEKIVPTYQFPSEEPRYSRCVSMEEIAENDFNLNISHTSARLLRKRKWILSRSITNWWRSNRRSSRLRRSTTSS